MAVTDQQFTDLVLQVANLQELAQSLVTSKEVSDVNNMLEDAIKKVSNTQTTLKERVNLAQKALNSLSLRFSKYAENETLLNSIADRVVSQDQFDALVGSDGTPSDSNKFVTNSDPRNTNARTPTAHAISHAKGGTDELDHDSLQGADGHKTHAQIDADLTSLLSSVTALTTAVNTLETQFDNIVGLSAGSTEIQTAYDSVDSDIEYIGEAPAGSDAADSVWKISRILEQPNGNISREFADGESTFDKVWDDRESLTYL